MELSSFQLPSPSLIPSTSGLGIVPAQEEEVRTKRLAEGEAAAERRIERVPATTGVMTSSGSRLNVRTDATWATPLTPVSHQLCPSEIGRAHV